MRGHNKIQSQLPRQQEAGYVLMLVLVSLLILMLGALYIVRGSLQDSIGAGNTAQRQKNVQVADSALVLAEKLALETAAASGNRPLEIAAAGKPWFFVPTTTPWPAPGAQGDNAGYWAVCSETSMTAPCALLSNMPGGYIAKTIIVPTNRPTNNYSCGTTGYTAIYYDIFLRVTEPNGKTSANTETVFKLCTPT